MDRLFFYTKYPAKIALEALWYVLMWYSMLCPRVWWFCVAVSRIAMFTDLPEGVCCWGSFLIQVRSYTCIKLNVMILELITNVLIVITCGYYLQNGNLELRECCWIIEDWIEHLLVLTWLFFLFLIKEIIVLLFEQQRTFNLKSINCILHQFVSPVSLLYYLLIWMVWMTQYFSMILPLLQHLLKHHSVIMRLAI